MEEIRALPLEEQRVVYDEILRLQERLRGWEEQRAALRRLQASCRGKGLSKALLAERAKERARG